MKDIQCPSRLLGKTLFALRQISDRQQDEMTTYKLTFGSDRFAGVATLGGSSGPGAGFALACRQNFCGGGQPNCPESYDIDFYWTSGPAAGQFSHGQIVYGDRNSTDRFSMILNPVAGSCARPSITNQQTANADLCKRSADEIGRNEDVGLLLVAKHRMPSV